MKKFMLLALMLSLSAAAVEYNVVDRYKLMEDKYKLQNFLNDDPDYWNILHVGGGLNLDVFDVIKDVRDFEGDATQAATLLGKYQGTEHFAKLDVGIEIPLFHFTAWGVKVRPTLNTDVSLGALVGISKESLNVGDLASMMDGIPAEIEACLDGVTMSDFAAEKDIVKVAEAACGLPAGTFSDHYDEFLVTNDFGSLETVLSMMAKMDVKSGLNFNLSKGNFFGKVGIGALFRSDFSAIITAATLASNEGLEDKFTKFDLNGFLVTDLIGGYKFGIFSVAGGIEELKLANTMDKSDESGEINYGHPVLMRLHGQADLSLLGFKLRPFVGFSRRSGYSFIDGAYAGADLGFYFLKDRFGMGLRGMVDRSHFSLGIQPRLGIIQLNFLAKVPVASEVDGVKPPTLVSADLNIFI